MASKHKSTDEKLHVTISESQSKQKGLKRKLPTDSQTPQFPSKGTNASNQYR